MTTIKYNWLILLKIVLYNMAIVDIKTLEDSSSIKIPIFVSNISAGFPSPADDHIEKRLDLKGRGALINYLVGAVTGT